MHFTCINDACTRSFHLRANHRQRKDFIEDLKVDIVLVVDQAGKATVVDSFFDQLLGSAPEHGFLLDLDFLGVQPVDLSGLETSSRRRRFGESSALRRWTNHLARMASPDVSTPPPGRSSRPT